MPIYLERQTAAASSRQTDNPNRAWVRTRKRCPHIDHRSVNNSSREAFIRETSGPLLLIISPSLVPLAGSDSEDRSPLVFCGPGSPTGAAATAAPAYFTCSSWGGYIHFYQLIFYRLNTKNTR